MAIDHKADFQAAILQVIRVWSGDRPSNFTFNTDQEGRLVLRLFEPMDIPNDSPEISLTKVTDEEMAEKLAKERVTCAMERYEG